MSNYYVKILELIGIENRNDKHYLRINFTFKESIEILLEIDGYTANNLEKIVQFNGRYKYRLSFKAYNDKSNKQQLAVITKTLRDKSEILYFLCSRDYINKLTSIKNIEDINDLDKLSFILRKPSSIDEKKEFRNIILSKEKPYNFPNISTAIISFILILVFSYLSHLYLNKIYFNEGVLAESIQFNTSSQEELQFESITYYNTDPNVEEDFYEDEELIEEVSNESLSSENNDLPFVELEDRVSYGLPKGKVALTFDDGPSQYTKEIIDILREYNVGATFFLVGYNVNKYPDYVNYIYSNGYSIGSHSINHFNMKKLSYDKQKKELIDSIEMLKEIVHEDITLFRPPYGSYNEQLVNLAADYEYKIVLWNNDPEDWKTRNPNKIFESIKNSNTSGAIILLHESQAVVDSLPKIIEYLQEQDLEIVNLK